MVRLRFKITAANKLLGQSPLLHFHSYYCIGSSFGLSSQKKMLPVCTLLLSHPASNKDRIQIGSIFWAAYPKATANPVVAVKGLRLDCGLVLCWLGEKQLSFLKYSFSRLLFLHVSILPLSYTSQFWRADFFFLGVGKAHAVYM